MLFNRQPDTHTLSLGKSEGRWDVYYSGTKNPEPFPIFEGLTHLSSALLFIAEGLRRLEPKGGHLEVVDPSGEWAKWVESRFTIPTHTIFS